MADSSIRIDTRIDNQGIIKGVRESAEQISKITKAFKDTNTAIEDQKKIIAEMEGEYKKAAEAADNIFPKDISDRLKHLTNQIQTLETGLKKPELLSTEQIETAKRAIKSYYDEAERLTEPFAAATDEANKFVYSIQGDLKVATQELKQLENTSTDLSNTLERLTASRPFNISEQAQQSRADIQAFEDTLKNLNAELEKETEPANLRALQYEIAQTEQAYENFRNTLSAPVEDVMNMQNVEAKLESARQKMQEVYEEHQLIKDTLTDPIDIQIETEKLEQAQAEVQRLKSELDSLQAISPNLKPTENAVRGLGNTMNTTGLSARQMGAAIGMAVGGGGSIRGIITSLSGMFFMLGGTMDVVKIKATAMWAAVTLGISLVINGITELIAMFKRFSDKINDTIESVAEGFKNLAKSLSKKLFTGIENGFKAFIANIKDSISQISIFNFSLKSLGDNLSKIPQKLIDIGKQTTAFKMLNGAITEARNIVASWFMSNELLRTQINQITVNILTGLLPVFQALLPIIHLLAQLVNMLSYAFASLMATLFGTTTSAANKAAKALTKQAEAFKNLGKEAKKIAGMLPIDEMNKISQMDMSGGIGGGGPGGLDWDSAFPDISKLQKLLDAIKGAFTALIDSLKRVWDRWGEDIVASWKRAFKTVEAFLITLFNDLERLFGSATWDRFLDAIAKNVILIADLITGIFGALHKAWIEGDRGYKMLESFVILGTELLELVHSIGRSFLAAWNENDRGVKIFGHLLEIITNINHGIANIARNIRIAWDENDRGKTIWGNILDVVEIFLGHINHATQIFRNWADGLNFAPLLDSIIKLTAALKPLTDVVMGKLVTFFEQFLEQFLEVAKTFIEIVANGFEKLAKELEGADTLFDLIGIAVIGLADILANVLYAVLDDIDFGKLGSDFANGLNKVFADPEEWIDIGKTLGTLVNSALTLVGEFIRDFDFKQAAESLTAAIRGFFEQVKPQDVADVINNLVNGLLEFFNNVPLDEIIHFAEKIIKAIDWKKAVQLIGKIDEIKQIPSKIFDMIVKEIKNIKIGNILGDVIQGMIDYISDPNFLRGAAIGADFGGTFMKVLLDVVFKALPLAIVALARFGIDLVLGLLAGIGSAVIGIFEWLWDNLVKPIIDAVKKLFGIASPSTVFAEIGRWLIEGLLAGIIEVFKSVAEFFGNIFAGLVEFFDDLFTKAWEAVKNAWSAVSEFFSGVWKGITDIFSVVINWFKETFTKAWDGIKGVWDAVVGWFEAIWDGIVGVFQVVGTWFKDKFNEAWENIKGIWNAVKGFFTDRWNDIVGVFSVAASWFRDTFSQAWENIKSVFAGVGAFFQSVWDTITRIFTSIGIAIGDAISGAVKNAVNTILGFAENVINGFLKAINVAIGIINAIPGVRISKLELLNIPRLATGLDYVPYDEFPAFLHKGERVMPAAENAAYTSLLDTINGFSPTRGMPTVPLMTGGEFTYNVTQTLAEKGRDYQSEYSQDYTNLWEEQQLTNELLRNILSAVLEKGEGDGGNLGDAARMLTDMISGELGARSIMTQGGRTR